MRENIADLGGLSIARGAYHASLKGRPAPVIGGLTGDQRFFLARAQAFAAKWRPEAIRKLTGSDPHSWNKYRVDGAVRNVDAWYAVRMDSQRFTRLSERQRDYLRQVFQHRNSQEIAFASGVSARAVDKQLFAKDIISANEAARLLPSTRLG